MIIFKLIKEIGIKDKILFLIILSFTYCQQTTDKDIMIRNAKWEIYRYMEAAPYSVYKRFPHKDSLSFENTVIPAAIIIDTIVQKETTDSIYMFFTIKRYGREVENSGITGFIFKKGHNYPIECYIAGGRAVGRVSSIENFREFPQYYQDFLGKTIYDSVMRIGKLPFDAFIENYKGKLNPFLEEEAKRRGLRK